MSLSRQSISDQDRKIPIYFRLIQKDIWMRMHVDTRSTIGAIKDAFLERIEMAPHDPSLQVSFYDDARWAMARQNATQQEARYLPKAFVARAPKRSIKELLKVENDMDAASLFTSASAKVGARKTSNSKSVSTSGQARAILGSDAGLGGRGTLGFVSANLIFDDDALHSEIASFQHSSAGKSIRHSASPYTPAFLDDAHEVNRGQQRPRVTSQPSESSQERDRDHPDSTRTAEQSFAGSDIDILIASGLIDAEAVERWSGRLPGNEDALRLERKAISTLQTANFHQMVSQDSDIPVNGPSSKAEHTAQVEGFDFCDGQVKDAKGDSNDSAADREDDSFVGSTKDSQLSSDSSVAEDRLDREPSVIDGTDAAHPDSSPAASQIVGERARSGTIVPSEAQRRAVMNASTAMQGLSTPSTTATTSSTDHPIAEADLMKLPAAHMAMIGDSQTQTSLLRAESQYASVATGTGHASAVPTAARRLAGIHTDEISSWRDAQHGQARHFAIHSFSNGHVLEDWRTVAALRLRPYELLEVQSVDVRDKVHLPRSGEATNVCTRKGLAKAEKEDISTSFGPLPSSSNPALHAHYLEPYAESWAYIFKRGSGTSRTQRAGLGLWKLRWICLHSNRIFVFRSKPPRFAFDEAIIVWNLDSVDTVFAERADGATRPHLPTMAGQCQDILSLTFRPPHGPGTLFEESIDYSQLCVSMRFVTQLDHCAFFRTCSRAHFRAALRRKDEQNASMVFEWRRKALARATIAGVGGTVIPGKAARRGGRNALSRTRLRPSGIKREFDDADRWSSDSEMEDFIPSSASRSWSDHDAFNYIDAVLASLPLNVEPSGLPVAASSVNVSSYSKVGSPESSSAGHQPVTPLAPSWAKPRGSGSRQRGFTTSTPTSSALQSSKASNALTTPYYASPTQVRLQHAMSMRSLASQGGVGLGVTANGGGVNVNATATELGSPSLTVSPVAEGVGARQDAPIDVTPRPIVSPELELEQSPAAQAIHSFLAQRSSSRSSNLSRTRSATIATPSMTDSRRFSPDTPSNVEGNA